MGAMREAMVREMALRGFAQRTQETYVGWMSRLVSQTRTAAEKLFELQVRTYLADLSRRGLSASTLNQAISAVRFFFNNVLHRKWQFDILYQRAPQRLPITLSPDEVGRLLAAVSVLRDRAAMEIAYAGGRRLNEVLHLKLDAHDHPGDGQTYQQRHLRLQYQGVTEVRSTADPSRGLMGPMGCGDLGYDELELLSDGLLEHRFLFSTGIELLVRFQDVEPWWSHDRDGAVQQGDAADKMGWRMRARSIQLACAHLH